MKLPADLKGDGRCVVGPAFSTPVPQEARCRKVTLSQARKIVRSLINNKQTTHSAGANTMWVPLEWCKKNGHECTVIREYDDNGDVAWYVVQLESEVNGGI